jgi:hypothetical protein
MKTTKPITKNNKQNNRVRDNLKRQGEIMVF